MTLLLALLLTACTDATPVNDDSDAPGDSDTPVEEGPPPLAGAPVGFTPHALRRRGDGWLVAGEAGGDVAVVALDAARQVDDGWGDDGVVLVDLGGPSDGPLPGNLDAGYDVVVDEDGAWVGGVGWGVVTAGAGRMATLRLDGDGALDPGFGDGGRVVTDWGAPAGVQRLSRDGAGVVAWGFVQNPSGTDLAAVRYDVAGAVDDTFTDGDGGAGLVALAGGDDGATVLLPEGDGHLVGGGAFALWRIGANGAIDGAYGDAGRQRVADGRLDLAASRPEGGAWLVGVGIADVDGDERGVLRLARVDESGAPDAAFGVRDVVIPVVVLDLGDEQITSAMVRARGAVARPGGGLVVYAQIAGLVNQLPALMVLDEQGALDEGFGEGGVMVLPGALAVLEGVGSAVDDLLALDGGVAVIADRWLYDAPGGGVEARAVVVGVPL